MQRAFKFFSFPAVFTLIFLSACRPDPVKPDYRGEMRKFVERISEKAKAQHPGFIVIPQNGLALLTSDGTPSGNPETAYINAIDGVGQEELWYGYDNNDNVATPDDIHNELLGQCTFARNHGLKVLVTDYASSTEKMDDSYAKNFSNGFISFAADHRDLDNIPSHPAAPFHSDTNQVASLPGAKNFLYFISPPADVSKEDFVNAIAQTDYDLVIMDISYDELTFITPSDLNRMRTKVHGGTRKIICYMSIGEAETYRWYWKPYWKATPPSFLVAEDPYWPDNFSVRYWDTNWQGIICNSNDSYLQKIIDAGFDGVYLDLVSNYEYFEE
jgi:cysteinyl-tRNA synthetase